MCLKASRKRMWKCDTFTCLLYVFRYIFTYLLMCPFLEKSQRLWVVVDRGKCVQPCKIYFLSLLALVFTTFGLSKIVWMYSYLLFFLIYISHMCSAFHREHMSECIEKWRKKLYFYYFNLWVYLLHFYSTLYVIKFSYFMFYSS